MNKLLPIALLFVSCDMMFLVPEKGDPYILSAKEEMQINNIFGEDVVDWAKDNVYWGDTGDDWGRYYMYQDFILLSDAKEANHQFFMTIIHEITHKVQYDIGDTDNDATTYDFSVVDLERGNLSIEQTAEAVRIYSMWVHMFPRWSEAIVQFRGNSFTLNATLASYFYKVLDKLELKNYKRPTF